MIRLFTFFLVIAHINKKISSYATYKTHIFSLVSIGHSWCSNNRNNYLFCVLFIHKYLTCTVVPVFVASFKDTLYLLSAYTSTYECMKLIIITCECFWSLIIAFGFECFVQQAELYPIMTFRICNFKSMALSIKKKASSFVF